LTYILRTNRLQIHQRLKSCGPQPHVKNTCLQSAPIRVGVDHTMPSTKAHDLGIFIDTTSQCLIACYKDRVRVLYCATAAPQHQTVMSLPPPCSSHCLSIVLVMPRFNYCNVTLMGIPTFQHRRLQSVLNAAARLIHGSSRH